MPKISVIVPVYNAEKYLHRCIDSILAQTFTDFELLLIDDGSKDSSGAICDEYAEQDPRVRVFHKENGGVSSARNVGLDNAKGEWVTFCDSDDWVGIDWLAIYKVSQARHTELYVQGIDMSYSNDRRHFIHVGTEFNEDIKQALIILGEIKILGYPVQKIFLRELIECQKLRFNEEFKIREDFDFVIRYAKYCKTVICRKEGTYKYEVPDYKTKYVTNDVFYCNCSIFSNLREIYGKKRNTLTDRIFTDINNAIFDSYARRAKDRRVKLKKYLSTINGVEHQSNLSPITKSILLTKNEYIINLLFELKAVIRK